MNELVSIIVPVYNVEKYLYNCVKSILSQTYNDIEIILVDDGSTDNSGIICDDFALEDVRVKVIHKTNGGLSDARNSGISVARGEYIVCVDSDDYIAPYCIEYLVELIEKYNADISICGLKKTSSLSEHTKDAIPKISLMNSTQAIERMLYADEFSTSACGRLFKSSLFKDIEFPIGKYSEDLFTVYKLFMKSERIVYSSRIGYYYYCRPNSILTSSFSYKHMDTVDAMHQIYKDVVFNKKELKPAYECNMIGTFVNIVSKKPPKEFLYDNGLWDEVKAYRCRVMKDKKAPKRIRGYAILLFGGLNITAFVIKWYYKVKWRKSMKEE